MPTLRRLIIQACVAGALGLGVAGAGAYSVEIQLGTGPLQLHMPLVQLPTCDPKNVTALAGQFSKAQLVAVDPQRRDALVQLAGKQYSVAQSFVRQGLAFAPGHIDQSIEDAVAERRGYWRCAPLTVLFRAAGTESDERVLAAIALNESELQPGVPWPWTINHAGKPLRFQTRAQAVSAAKRLIAAGDERFDVGPMQVNWFYHKTRFTSIEAAFSPVTNIRVADSILMNEFKRVKDWHTAVARYHAPGNPERGRRYAKGVQQKLAKVVREITQWNVRSLENLL